MTTRRTNFVEEEFYHIYNRGNSKQTIFHNKEDMDHFLQLLCISNKRKRFLLREVTDSVYMQERESPLVAVGSYCLMPNHFHLLLTPVTENGISLFIQKLSTGYAMYYNKKYKHTGGLFEGKFKSSYIDNDNYLKYIFSYIHLNPVKLIDPTWKTLGLKDENKSLDYLRRYKYSSYYDFLNKGNKSSERDESVIINTEPFPKYFPNNKSFEREITNWLSLKPYNTK